jgi:hypothetical protein
MKKIAILIIILSLGIVGFSQQLEVRFNSEFQKDSEVKTL